MPNTASSTIAAIRPYSLAWTAHAPPTAASVATAANVTAIPMSRGSPLRTNGWSARAKTKGSTGRMHGLTNRQHAAEIGEDEEGHLAAFLRFQAAPALNVIATPFMQ